MVLGISRRRFMIKQALIVAALLGAAPAFAAPTPATGETRVRNMAEYLEAVADPMKGVYIRDYRGRWFYARVLGECPRLTRTASLRFQPSPGGDFDRHSALRADGWRCMISSVTASDGPPH
jgi:hypothetical protein